MKTIALFVGSFNPFHIGHMNVLVKAERIFGKGNVLVAMGINPDKLDIHKTNEHIKRDEAVILSKKLRREVIVYTSFLHELVDEYEKNGYNVVIIRGLRNSKDFEYDLKQMRFVNDFKPNINVIYITCDRRFDHISSSDIKKIEEFGGHELVKNYLV